MSKDKYLKVAKDNSGSRTQNRFKFQRFWSIKKIYDLFNDESDFIAIFDFACDLDIFVNNSFNFYQIKTSKSKNFTINQLIKNQNSASKSILETLSYLDNIDGTKTLNIVSNTALSEMRSDAREVNILCFNDLKEEMKESIKEHINQKNKFIPNLNKYFYIKSDLCLDSSYETLLGHTLIFLEKKLNTNLTRVKYFLDWLIRQTESKSTNEYDGNSFEEIVKNKGITKECITNLLRDYAYSENEILKEVNNIIGNYKIFESSKLSKALFEITSSSNLNTKRIENILLKIRNYISNNEVVYNDKSTENIIWDLLNKTNFFDSSFDQYEKKCLIIIAITQFKKGME